MLINWMGPSQRPSELGPAFSLHLHKTSDPFAAETKDPLKATILLCLVERNQTWKVIQEFTPEACVTDVSFSL